MTLREASVVWHYFMTQSCYGSIQYLGRVKLAAETLKNSDEYKGDCCKLSACVCAAATFYSTEE